MEVADWRLPRPFPPSRGLNKSLETSTSLIRRQTILRMTGSGNPGRLLTCLGTISGRSSSSTSQFPLLILYGNFEDASHFRPTTPVSEPDFGWRYINFQPVTVNTYAVNKYLGHRIHYVDFMPSSIPVWSRTVQRCETAFHTAFCFAAAGEDEARCVGDSRPALLQVLLVLMCQEKENDKNDVSGMPDIIVYLCFEALHSQRRL